MAHILIIDDEEYIRALYKEELTDNGHRVSLAESADDALAQLRSVKFDLAILDIKLGDVNGLDFLQEINEEFKGVPVILCSAYDSFQEHDKAAVAAAYVLKSFDLARLKRTISSTLAERAG